MPLLSAKVGSVVSSGTHGSCATLAVAVVKSADTTPTPCKPEEEEEDSRRFFFRLLSRSSRLTLPLVVVAVPPVVAVPAPLAVPEGEVGSVVLE